MAYANDVKENVRDMYRNGDSTTKISSITGICTASIWKWLGSETRSISETKIGELNSNWKGDKVKYNALHAWIKRNKIKPELCECCHKVKPYDLANISGEYRRELNDWEFLCRKCHMIKDGRMSNLKRYESGVQRPEISGENSPNWKGGVSKDKLHMREYHRKYHQEWLKINRERVNAKRRENRAKKKTSQASPM